MRREKELKNKLSILLYILFLFTISPSEQNDTLLLKKYINEISKQSIVNILPKDVNTFIKGIIFSDISSSNEPYDFEWKEVNKKINISFSEQHLKNIRVKTIRLSFRDCDSILFTYSLNLLQAKIKSHIDTSIGNGWINYSWHKEKPASVIDIGCYKDKGLCKRLEIMFGIAQGEDEE